jgi:CHASE2 domain-containing sensor protein
MIVDSSAGSVIRTRFRAWSSVAEVVIVVVVVVVGSCCCWQLLQPFSFIKTVNEALTET